MFCPKCGTEIDNDSVFCYSCGAQVAQSPVFEQPRANTNAIDLNAIQNALNNGGTAGAVLPGVPVNDQPIMPRDTTVTGPIQTVDIPTDLNTTNAYDTTYHSNPIIDFMMRMTRPGNRLVMVWLFLNYLIFWAFTAAFLAETISHWNEFAQYATITVVSLLLALASYAIALSPIGEAILRWQNRCKKITDPQILAKLQPCFERVYAKAKALDPHLSDKIELFISDDKSINAFATGRNTICVTKGLAETPPEIIEATLAHEFGHLSHRDTDMILIVEVGNQIWTLLTTIFAITARIIAIVGPIFGAFTDDDGSGAIAAWLMAALMAAMVAVMRLWSKIGMLILLHSMRSHEYEADAFAVDLGYASALTSLLQYFSQFSEGAKGLFASLSSTHPEPEQRLEHIRQLTQVTRGY